VTRELESRGSDDAARTAAVVLAAMLRWTLEQRGEASVAVSGGTTPWLMLAELATDELPWSLLHVFQVDERVAPDGDPERNLTHLRESFLDRVAIPADHVHVMDVTASDLDAAAAEYEAEVRRVTGGILDVVHLGLGDDGHTASLAPGGRALEERERLVVTTDEAFRGHRRMTLTLPALDAAHYRLWLVTGESKGAALERLRRHDTSIPAGRVHEGPGDWIVFDLAARGVHDG
jgi:6-phosphogluconolactonase